MKFIWSIISKDFFYYSSSPIIQIVVGCILLIFTAFLLKKTNALNFEFTQQRKLFFIILIIITPITSLFIGFEFEDLNILPIPFVPIEINYIFLPLSFLSLITAGIYLGPKYAVFLAFISGSLIGGYVSHNPFTIWLFVITTLLYTLLIRQNINIKFYNIFREPFVSYFVLILIYPFIEVIDSMFFVEGILSIRIEYYISHLGINWLVFILNFLFSALVAQIIKIFFPLIWVQPRYYKQPIRRRTLVSTINMIFIPVFVFSFSLLSIFSWYQSGNQIKNHQKELLKSQTERIDESLQVLFSTGRTLIEQYSKNKDLLFDDFKKIETDFKENINSSNFFDSLTLIDHDTNIITQYPKTDSYKIALTTNQKNRINLAFNDVSIQIYPVTSVGNTTTSQILFIIPIIDTNDIPCRVLIASTTPDNNPYFAPILSSISIIENSGGNSIILTPQNELIFADDNLDINSLFLEDNIENGFSKLIKINGVRQENYSIISNNTGWKIINFIPTHIAREVSVFSGNYISIFIGIFFIIIIILLNIFSYQLGIFINTLNENQTQNNKISKELSFLPIELQNLNNNYLFLKKEFKELLEMKDFFINLRSYTDFQITNEKNLDSILDEVLRFGAESARIIIFHKKNRFDSNNVIRSKGRLTSNFDDFDMKLLTIFDKQQLQSLNNKNEINNVFNQSKLIPEKILISKLFDENNEYGFIWSAYFHAHNFSEIELNFMKDISNIIVDLINLKKDPLVKNDITFFEESFIEHPDIIFNLNSNGIVENSNKKAKEILSIKINNSIDEIPIIKNNKRFYFMFRGSPEKFDQYELEWQDKIYFISVKKIHFSEDEYSWLCIMQDITSNRSKELNTSNLLLAVNKDFQNSLKIISDNVEMLSQFQNINSSMYYHLEKIQNQSNYLDSQIKAMFDKTKIDSGIKIYKDFSNLNEIVSKVLHRLQPDITQKSIKVIPNDLDKKIFVDKSFFGMVLFNIIENAIKNSKDKGSIEIKSNINQNNIEIYVIDHGNGIAPIDIENIFEPYYQINSNGINGQGLGLYISKNIVQKHGGEIICESKLGAGSIFKIILPNDTNQ